MPSVFKDFLRLDCIAHYYAKKNATGMNNINCIENSNGLINISFPLPVLTMY